MEKTLSASNKSLGLISLLLGWGVHGSSQWCQLLTSLSFQALMFRTKVQISCLVGDLHDWLVLHCIRGTEFYYCRVWVCSVLVCSVIDRVAELPDYLFLQYPFVRKNLVLVTVGPYVHPSMYANVTSITWSYRQLKFRAQLKKKVDIDDHWPGTGFRLARRLKPSKVYHIFLPMMLRGL